MTGRTVLVVDDDDGVRLGIRGFLAPVAMFQCCFSPMPRTSFAARAANRKAIVEPENDSVKVS